jgi:HK97 family phage major capsid protein
MARQSVIALDATLRQTLVANVAQVLDKALWDGDGTSNTIKGILRATGIATGTLDLTDADTLIDGRLNVLTCLAPCWLTAWAHHQLTTACRRG